MCVICNLAVSARIRLNLYDRKLARGEVDDWFIAPPSLFNTLFIHGKMLASSSCTQLGFLSSSQI